MRNMQIRKQTKNVKDMNILKDILALKNLKYTVLLHLKHV